MSWNSELVWTFLILFWWQNVFNRIESWIKWRCLFWLQEEDVCWKILISSNSGKIFVPDPKECHDMIKYLTKRRGKKMTDYASEKIHVSFGVFRWKYRWRHQGPPGVNFINILQAAFAPVDPKSVKRYWQLDWIIMLLGATGVKAVGKYVDEIDYRCQFHHHFMSSFFYFYVALYVATVWLRKLWQK